MNPLSSFNYPFPRFSKRYIYPCLCAGFASAFGTVLCWGQEPTVSPAPAQHALHDLPQSQAQDMPLPNAKAAAYITTLAQGANGDLWAAGEDCGAWYYNAAAKKWTQFTVKNGLGDDTIYALTIDRRGRVWAGHLNHGVSVWNGVTWKNYPVGSGPLGERIFALATNPVTGDVWMATNAGLSCYSDKTGQWTHLTKANGLPSHEIAALAFDSIGTLYVATQCDGLLIGHTEQSPREWRHIAGSVQPPTTEFGDGLPSNQLCDVMVSDDDTVWVATNCGIANSKDNGESWHFVRGDDWVDKAKGRYQPREIQLPTGALPEQPLREDYVTGLAEDARGLLWISYRRRGYEIRRPLTGRVAFASAPEKPGDADEFPYVSTLLPLPDGRCLLGTYKDGLRLSVDRPAFIPTKEEQQVLDTRRDWKIPPALQPNTPLPKEPAVPTRDELQALLTRLQAVPEEKTPPVAVALDEDWTTQGDWLGRYGRYFMVGCAMISPHDYLWGAGSKSVDYNLRIDPRETHNHLRYWVHWLSTGNHRALEMPPVYGDSRFVQGLAKENEERRQSEVDDNGETMPLTKEGPNVYATIQIPEGDFILSFYNHNKDGHDWLNRMRDYALSLRVHPGDKPLDDVHDFDSWPELVHSRQRDFWGGVYKRFAVHGPVTLTLKMDKNHSLNTILAGMFLDEAGAYGEQPEPYFFTEKGPTTPAKRSEEETLIDDIWKQIERIKAQNPTFWAADGRHTCELMARQLEAMRPRTASDATPLLQARQGTCFYVMGQYSQWEAMQRRLHLTPARDIEKSLKWDKVHSFSGKGYGTVKKYVVSNLINFD